MIFKVENDGSFSFIETRAVKPVCNYGNHDDEQLIENLQKIKDCKYFLVSKIGTGASIQAERLGITPMELPDMIEESIRKVISFDQIQNLFEGIEYDVRNQTNCNLRKRRYR